MSALTLDELTAAMNEVVDEFIAQNLCFDCGKDFDNFDHSKCCETISSFGFGV